MTTVLPGRLTTVAKHTFEFFGRLLKASGVVLIERPQDAKDAEAARQRNADRISSLSSTLAQGEAWFSQGGHACGRRRMKSALRGGFNLACSLAKAEAAGLPKPNVVPWAFTIRNLNGLRTGSRGR